MTGPVLAPVPLGVAERACRLGAPLLLLVSVLGRMAVTFGIPDGLNLVDLRVYSYGAASLGSGGLYTFTYSDLTPDFPLPFTYPPFAAMLMVPLHWVPSFTVLAVLWQLATVAALYGVVRLSLRMLVGEHCSTPGWQSLALVWTAVGVWLEPVRTTLNFGQVNVFLVLGVLLAVNTQRWWVAGGIVGLLAGIKLTPAITGLYLLGRRNVRAAAFSAVAFAGTVVLSFVLVPSEARTYFFGVGTDASRVGPVGSAINQSLRGALSRLLGHDVGTGPAWLVAVAVAAAVAALAWWRLDRSDRLGQLLVVQLLGLLGSPISWSHHWVWFVPVVLWLVHGPRGRTLAARVLATVLLVVLAADVISLMLALQPSIWDFSRPFALAVTGTVYPALAGAVLLLMVRGDTARPVAPLPAVRVRELSPQPAAR